MRTFIHFSKKGRLTLSKLEIPLYMLKEKHDNMGVKKTRIVMEKFSSFITFNI